MKFTSTNKGLMLLAGAMALGGCVKLDGQINGGGTMNSLGGAGTATFTVAAKRCDTNGDGVSEVSGRVNFQDKTAIDWAHLGGVSFNAEVVSAGLCGLGLVANTDEAEDNTLACETLCEPGNFEVNFAYRSTNPNLPGDGTGFVCLTDTGEGASKGLEMNGLVRAMVIQSGPYHVNGGTGNETYWNKGTVSGNINAKECGGPSDDETNG